MPVYKLDEEFLSFPPATETNPEGLLAIGGKLSEDWLLTAYANGLFPWFNPGEPILWWSPDPRCVIFPDKVHISKSMHRVLNNSEIEFRLDTNFESVIRHCANVDRKDENGTWITDEMIDAYSKLYDIGMAHSAELYRGDELIGGLYGVSIGSVFFGESMFSMEKNASKVVLIRLCAWLQKRGFELFDCQIFSPHLARMGAEEMSRVEFLRRLESGLEKPTIRGKWDATNDFSD